jgi:hypothetical protein
MTAGGASAGPRESAAQAALFSTRRAARCASGCDEVHEIVQRAALTRAIRGGRLRALATGEESTMKNIATSTIAIAFVGATFVLACSARDPGAEDESASQSSELTSTDPCTQPLETPNEALDCLDYIAQRSPFQCYVINVYDCKNFSNDFCSTLSGSENIACAELGVQCNTPGMNGGITGHVVSVVFLPDIGCVAYDPQDGEAWGPWPAENGSCNTYASNLPTAICASIGGAPNCTTGLVRGGFPLDGNVPPCVPVASAVVQ